MWQLNDCWPTTSWAIADYYLLRKAAYYSIRRALLPVAVGVCRKFHDWTMRPADELWKRDTGHVDLRPVFNGVEFDVWVASSRLCPVEAKVTINIISIKSGGLLKSMEKSLTVQPNGTTEVMRKFRYDEQDGDANKPFQFSQADPVVVHIMVAVDGQIVSTDVSWPDPIKYLSFEERGVEVSYSQDKRLVRIVAKKPVKGFSFSELKGVTLSDNGFDIMPGEVKEITVDGTMADRLRWMYIGK